MKKLYIVNGGTKDILPTKDAVISNSSPGYVADALVTKELYQDLDSRVEVLESNSDSGGSVAASVSFDIVETMQKDASLKEGQICVTAGYYKANDGGGQIYRIESSARSFAIALPSGMYANPQIESVANIRKFGAAAGGASIGKIVADLFSIPEVDTVFVPIGEWNLSATVVSSPRKYGILVPEKKTLLGEGIKSRIIFDGMNEDKKNAVGICMQSYSAVKNINLSLKSSVRSSGGLQEYAIFSYRADRPYIEGVKISLFNAIGIGFVGCNCGQIINCDISECGNSKAGIWDAHDSNYSGSQGHTLIDRTKSYKNQLDGILFSGRYLKVINSEFYENGYGGSYGGAYGAGGIVSVDDAMFVMPTMINNYCHDNSEYGINVSSWQGVVANNVCHKNGLAGIFIKGPSAEVMVSGNICNDNGSGTLTSAQEATFGDNRNGITVHADAGKSYSVYDLVLANNICAGNKKYGLYITKNSNVSPKTVSGNIGTTNF